MILRTHFGDGSKSLKDLGNEFQLVEKEVSPERFNQLADYTFGKDPDKLFTNDTLGFIVYGPGETEPIYKNFSYYILNNSGSLFQTIHEPKEEGEKATKN